MRPRQLLPTIVLEIGTRLTLFASVLALFTSVESIRDAAALAGIASVCGFARTWWRGNLLRERIEILYRRIVDAVAAKPTAGLMANREHGQAVGLVDAVYEIAMLQSVAVPDFIGAVGAVLVVLAVVAVRLGIGWLVLGAALAGALVLVFAPARKAAKRARERGWAAHMASAKLLDAMLAASPELRASERERAMGDAIDAEARRLALAERSGVRLGAVTAVLPAVLAVCLVLLPRAWVGSLFGNRAGEVAVLAAAGVSYCLTLASTLEAIVRSAPVRATFNDFVGPERTTTLLFESAMTPRSAGEHAKAEDLRSLELRSVSVRHPDADHDTPHALSFRLERGGVALVGPNGTGKTTTLLAIVGLVDAREGSILVSGHPPSPKDWEAVRSSTLLIPQRPHVVPDQSIAWHLGLFGTRPADPSKLDPALDRVGLGSLASRARARGLGIAELPMGELSGGEQRRVTLARALVHDAALLLVDEPEAGLDQEGRAVVTKLLAELAQDRLIVVVAHDKNVIPQTFHRVELEVRAVGSIQREEAVA